MHTSYQRKLNEIHQRQKDMRHRLQTSLRELAARKQRDEAKIAVVERQLEHTQDELTEFLLDAVPFLQSYDMVGLDNQSKVALTTEFQRQFRCVETAAAAKCFVPAQTNDCAECGEANTLIDDTKNASIVCTVCGITQQYSIPDGVAGLTHAQRITLPPAPYTYKPLQHFIDMLNNVEAKTSRHVPREIVDEVRTRFKLMRVPCRSITPKDVRLLLRQIHQCRYYENIYHITRKLNPEYELIKIPEKRKQILKSIFREVYPRFFRNARRINPKRKNFLSYPYVAYKFCELCHWDEYMHVFQLLKSREKLRIQDAILKLIFAELKWNWIDTI
jgi:hypothetical protein